MLFIPTSQVQMPAHTEAPGSLLRTHGTGVRMVVRRTFIEVVEVVEVVEEGSGESLEGAVRRASSAPAAPGRKGGTSLIEQEEGAERISADPVVAQPSQEVGGQTREEAKTTVVLRNIPSHFTRDWVLQHLDARGFAGGYNFFYLPIDFAKRQNFGYCFVNLTSPELALRVFVEFDGLRWGTSGQGKAGVSWSLTQGLDSHIVRYRNSPVMHEVDECRPIVLERGVRVVFPPPTRKVQRLSRLRWGSRGSRDFACVEAQQGEALPATPPGSWAPLPGLPGAPGGAAWEADTIQASPFFAGLGRKGAGAPPAAPRRHRERAAVADLWGSEQRVLHVLSSDGSGALPDGRRGGSKSAAQPAQPWKGSVLSARVLGCSGDALSSGGSVATPDSRRRGPRSADGLTGAQGSMLAQGLVLALQR